MEKNGTEEILKRISDRRKELGMSYQDLADATGLAKTTLQRYETGHITNIPINRIDALSAPLPILWDGRNAKMTISPTK